MSCEERWSSIRGFEGFYEISTLGRVKSLARVVQKSNGAMMRIKERIMKPRSQKSGHLLIWLCRNGQSQARNVHRLVADAFLSPCPEGMECCHNNGIASDNRLENLRWDTRSKNIKQSYEDGRTVKVPGLKGLAHPCSKLTEAQVEQIRQSLLSCAAAATCFGVSPMTVSRCRRKITYAEVK